MFTSAATALILAESERILGGGEIVFDEDGNPHWLPKPGFIDRIIGEPLKWIFYSTGGVLVLSLLLFATSKVWKHNKMDRMAVKEIAEAKHSTSDKTDNG